MRPELKSMSNEQAQGVETPKEGAASQTASHTVSLEAAKVAVEGVLRNRQIQVGTGVAMAAGAGLLLVSLFGVGAAAVAGAAGYLAYREMTGKR